MTSKTFCCDGTLFSKTLRRFWPLWTAYLLIWLLVLPLGLHNALQYPYYTTSAYYNNTAASAQAQELIYGVTRGGSLFLSFCMAPLAAMAVFSGLYEEKRAGVFASLPIRRESAFCSYTLAGLVPLLAAPLCAAALAALVALSNGCFLWTPFLTFLGITELYTLCFYGFAVLCAQLTGAVLIVPAVYVVLEFTAPVVELLIRALLSLFIYGYESIGADFGTYLSPFAAIFQHSGFSAVWEAETIVGWEFYGWGVAAICAVSGLLCLAAALLLYRKRRTESAGDVVAVRPLKKVFSFAMGIGCALVLSVVLADFFFGAGNLMGNRVTIVAVGFLLGGVIGYFGAEMLMRKSFRVFGACWRGGAILLAGLALLLAAMQFDFLGIERILPAAETIQSAQLYTAEGETTLYEPENIQKALDLNGYVLEHRTDGDRVSSYLRVTYVCGDRAVTRSYHRLPNVYDDTEQGAELARRLEELYNSDEALAARYPRNVDRKDFHYTEVLFWKDDRPEVRAENRSVEITAEQAYEWYTTCILPDVADGTLGRISFDEKTAPTVYNAECWLEVYPDQPPEKRTYTAAAYRQILIRPNTESLRTNLWLLEHGVELYTMPER